MRKKLAAREGQALILIALALTAITGMVALAVDIGHVYERRQNMQNIATSAAEAGAYETYAIGSPLVDEPLKLSESTADALVRNRMLHIVSQYNASIVPASGPNYVPNDSCHDTYTYSSTQLYMQAAYLDQNNFYIYLDSSNNPVTVDDDRGSPYYGQPVNDVDGMPLSNVHILLVGNGMYRAGSYYNTNPTQKQVISGVKVITLGGCVERFFAGVLGHDNFRVASDAEAGRPDTPPTDTPSSTQSATPSATASQTPSATASQTPSATASQTGTASPSSTPTITPTPTNTATPTNTPTATPFTAGFMIFGTPAPSPYPETLFAQGAPNAPNYPVGCPATGGPCTGNGDLVTIFANSSVGQWVSLQYATQPAGLSGVPDGSSIPVHDASMDGCFSSTVPLALGVPLIADYNHGGVGHCPTLPSLGQTIPVPVVWEVKKNDGSCSQNGGYCEIVEAIVLVRITAVQKSQVAQGFIVGIPASCSVYNPPPIPYGSTNQCDPQEIVEFNNEGDPPLPGGAPATATATATPIPYSGISLTITPNAVTRGSPAAGQITLSAAAPAGGLTVTLACSGNVCGNVTLPASVTVPAGQTSIPGGFTINTSNYPGSSKTATITATCSNVACTGTKPSATLTLN